MKAIKLFDLFYRNPEIMSCSWVVSIYSKKELSDFVSNATLICGSVKDCADYFVSEKPLDGFLSDAVLRDRGTGVNIYIYKID